MEKSIKHESYINIQWRMVSELKLKWNDLLVYAIISGFSNQETDHWFHGSLQYLADRTNSTKRWVQKNLQSLIEKWLIRKVETFQNWVKFCEYYALPFHSIEQSSTGYGTKFVGGMEQSSTNNISNNIVDNKEKNINKNEKTFQEFWDAYPKKKGKAKAFEYWCKIKDDKNLIIQKAKEYAIECKRKNIEDRFIKRPQWRLNEKRRNDDYWICPQKQYRLEKKENYEYSDLF